MNRSRLIPFLASAAAILLIAVGVASCGGSSGSSSNGSAANPPATAPANPASTTVAKPAKKAAPAPAPAPAPQASAPSNGIPQGDVGDNDSDNHGGPDDGDGGIEG
jgi:hypothetical protein